MDFTLIEREACGGNVEEDEELLAELVALQQEEETKQRSFSSCFVMLPPMKIVI